MESKKQQEDKKEQKERPFEERALRARVEDDDLIFFDYIPADAPVFFDD
jgi:hypothetical protein